MKYIDINKNEVLRYLGHKGQELDERMIDLIDECIRETKLLIMPRYIYDYKKISIIDNEVYIEGTNLILKGNDIKEHLKNSDECVLMAATLGNKIEMKIKLYEKINLTKAVVLDSCATTAIEEICDKVEAKIKEECLNRNKNITYRYSPGYGDLSLDIQKDFLNVLNANSRIGLTCSENNILFPRKSVTAIIGIIDKDLKVIKKSCKDCNKYLQCNFRKEGKTCGA